jgi:hypothetical protein
VDRFDIDFIFASIMTLLAVFAVVFLIERSVLNIEYCFPISFGSTILEMPIWVIYKTIGQRQKQYK